MDSRIQLLTALPPALEVRIDQMDSRIHHDF
jgi:hypothetical protein